MTIYRFNLNCALSSPCKNCSKRKLNCHDQCELYAEYKGKIKDIDDNRSKYVEGKIELFHHLRLIEKRHKK